MGERGLCVVIVSWFLFEELRRISRELVFGLVVNIAPVSREDDVDDRPEDLPDDVPAKATITIKEINDNRYYYWQWRDGEKIRSQYKGPVSPDE
ncbi:hypothetical protein C500_15155 [Natrialba magadii ATCC 43099]|uniref:DUF6788 domain-containing protein n=1 Tax=Natrialba magadii (strain ATCC 43099 / DSM 3394 / CCM 3739 / CIP 104546 / IAM 13178 / JCM 8861 / NBRC 102185 / NCIMB 2190 / MS3) TaxID=547559 RepID=L9UP81_NATMM|nr:hypothetical protein C500_15155 [Natrialba magadii ATCC 43099]